VHAITLAPSVRVEVNEVALAARLDFKEVTDYEGVDVGGTLRVKHAVAGTELLSEQLDLMADGTYTLLVTGRSANIDLVVARDTAAIPAPGTAKLRVMHSAADLPEVDIFLRQPGVADPFRLLFPFRFGMVSHYQQGDPGVYEITLLDAATADTLGSVTNQMVAGQVLTVVVLDADGGMADFAVLNDRS